MNSKKIFTRILQALGMAVGGFLLFRAIAHLLLAHSGPLVIPTCASSDVKSTIEDIVVENPNVARGTKVIDLDGIEERRWEPESQLRSCHATLHLNTGTTFIFFTIHPSSDKSNYLVELQEVPF